MAWDSASPRVSPLISHNGDPHMLLTSVSHTPSRSATPARGPTVRLSSNALYVDPTSSGLRPTRPPPSHTASPGVTHASDPPATDLTFPWPPAQIPLTC